MGLSLVVFPDSLQVLLKHFPPWGPLTHLYHSQGPKIDLWVICCLSSHSFINYPVNSVVLWGGSVSNDCKCKCKSSRLVPHLICYLWPQAGYVISKLPCKFGRMGDYLIEILWDFYIVIVYVIHGIVGPVAVSNKHLLLHWWNQRQTFKSTFVTWLSFFGRSVIHSTFEDFCSFF